MRTNTKKQKAALEAKRAELAEQMGLRADIAVERLSDTIDEVQQLEHRELTISTLNRNWETIRAIDEALVRIRDGSYGICESCGEGISEKRLKAVPWAALCIRCQSQRDAERDDYASIAA